MSRQYLSELTTEIMYQLLGEFKIVNINKRIFVANNSGIYFVVKTRINPDQTTDLQVYMDTDLNRFESRLNWHFGVRVPRIYLIVVHYTKVANDIDKIKDIPKLKAIITNTFGLDIQKECAYILDVNGVSKFDN